MTDKQQLINLLNKIDADFEDTYMNEIVKDNFVKTVIHINNSCKDKSKSTPGYYDFYSTWYFDENDSLLMIGNWEGVR
jgi:hypothetical protein